MYLDNLDELDQKIIQLLIENARISYWISVKKPAFPEWQ